MPRIELTINGKTQRAEVEPRSLLVDFLRDHLLLTGTHVGCEHGICGACTIELNGEIARSCITYAVQCDGAEIRTIESFDDDALMARLRTAFTEEHALQCGYCTPGMLVAARDLIRRRAARTEHDIRVAMSGNLCRCTGYQGIVRAIARVLAETSTAAIEAKPAWLGPAPGPGFGGEVKGVPRTDAARAEPTRSGATFTPGIEGATTIAQAVTLHHPRDLVWRYMADVAKIAECLPGAGLEGPVQDGRFTGRMTVRIGPIAAGFGGEGQVTRNDADCSGTLEGQGRDTRSSSRARGRIEYRLVEEGAAATLLEMQIAYSLAGPLAQFSRGGMVRDLVARITAEFARNLDARLANPEAKIAPAQLNPLALLWSTFLARVKRLFGG